MIEPTTRLTVLHDDNGSFVDRTRESADFLRDNYDLTLVAAEDYLYLGYSKEFGAAYCELTTPNANVNDFAAEYWDGTAWSTLDVTDETVGFTRSGFIFWNKSLMESTTVDSNEGFFIRLRPDADHTTVSVRGINLIFSDDYQLKSEFWQVDNSELYPTGETSHISTHVSARNKIIQMLRNRGYATEDVSNVFKDLDQWDMIDIFQIREAATHLALSTIFFNLFDNPEDHWFKKYEEHQKMFLKSMELAYLSIDDNNDGEDDEEEIKKQFRSQRFSR